MYKILLLAKKLYDEGSLSVTPKPHAYNTRSQSYGFQTACRTRFCEKSPKNAAAHFANLLGSECFACPFKVFKTELLKKLLANTNYTIEEVEQVLIA